MSYPSGLLSIGQTENITYFAADESDGYFHFSEFLNFNIEIPDVEVVPDNVVQESPDNIFVFIYVFNVSGVFNNTVTTTFNCKLLYTLNNNWIAYYNMLINILFSCSCQEMVEEIKVMHTSLL